MSSNTTELLGFLKSQANPSNIPSTSNWHKQSQKSVVLQSCKTSDSSTSRPLRKPLDSRRRLTHNTTIHQRCLNSQAAVQNLHQDILVCLKMAYDIYIISIPEMVMLIGKIWEDDDNKWIYGYPIDYFQNNPY